MYQSNQTNYYQTLQVDSEASLWTIRQAYRQAIKEFHPDLNGNSEYAHRKTQELNAAYAVIGNYEKRRLYDLGISLDQQARYRQRTQRAETYYRPPAPKNLPPWQQTKTGNGVKLPLARCSVWLGARGRNENAHAVFVYPQWRHDPTTHNHADILSQRLESEIPQAANRQAARQTANRIILSCMEQDNVAAGYTCAKCRQHCHSISYDSCYYCWTGKSA